MRPKVAFFEKVALIFFSIMIFILLTELAATILGVKTYGGEPVPDSFHANLKDFSSSVPDGLCSHDGDPGKIRIFAFGESSVQGDYKIDRKNLFPSVLQEMLDSSHPGKFEVVNMGKGSKDSYYIKRCMIRSLGSDPDILIVYAGHNDYGNFRGHAPMMHAFLKDNPWMIDTQVFLEENFRSYVLYQGILRRAREALPQKAAVSVRTRKEMTSQRFGRNLDQAIEKAAIEGVAVILVSPVANYKWYSDDVPSFEEAMAMQAGNLEDDESRRMAIYKEALLLERDGRYEDAMDRFLAYKGIMPQGWAPDEMRDSLRSLAHDHPDAYYLDFESRLVDYAVGHNMTFGCGFFGNDRYCDQLHPNELTHRLLAESLYPLVINLSGSENNR